MKDFLTGLPVVIALMVVGCTLAIVAPVLFFAIIVTALLSALSIVVGMSIEDIRWRRRRR